MSSLARKTEPLATDVSFISDALHVALADGREISTPLQRFPRLLRATPDLRAHWELIGDGIGIHWPDVGEDIEVESLVAI